MGRATLYFPNGPGMRFRIDPDEIGWDFKINSSVTPTIGGRVVQITGATLSDISITGKFGERHDEKAAKDEPEHPGVSWKLAVKFSEKIREMMRWQSDDTKTQPTAIFEYPPQGWKFSVYIKGFQDPDGGAISIRPEKFSHGYQLTLFVVQKGVASLNHVGDSKGVLNSARAKAINEYIGRISDGIGWKPTAFNGDFQDIYEGVYADSTANLGVFANFGTPDDASPNGVSEVD